MFSGSASLKIAQAIENVPLVIIRKSVARAILEQDAHISYITYGILGAQQAWPPVDICRSVVSSCRTASSVVLPARFLQMHRCRFHTRPGAAMGT